MGRQQIISQSILDAIFKNNTPDEGGSRSSVLNRVFTFFSLFNLRLARFRDDGFKSLRSSTWRMDEEEYTESFRKAGRQGGQLKPVGDLGYSGSTFFTTPNSKFLIKSIPRKFEHDFFRRVLLEPYIAHTKANPSSLLVRITDLLYAPRLSIGSILGTAPSHHIVMENVLHGKESTSTQGKWETYDLKPGDYFYPERDQAVLSQIASDETKDKLIDKFEDKIRVTKHERSAILDALSKDTQLLEEFGAVDYSLFLVRYPGSIKDVPRMPSGDTKEPWRTGLPSRDGKWVYRAVLLDFFWAKSALQAKAMTRLISSYNFFDRKGHMSITTTPEEYRSRFMTMVEGIVEDEGHQSQGEVHGQGA